MLVHPDFNPIAISFGPVAVRWYGLMYLVGFILFLGLGRWRARETWRGMSAQDVDDLLFFGVLGVIVGGRLGYVLFYKPAFYLSNPLEALMLWHGGMASHGGILGVLVAMFVFAQPWQEFFPDRRFCRAVGAAGTRCGPTRKFHQWRTLGSSGRPQRVALGHDLSAR